MGVGWVESEGMVVVEKEAAAVPAWHATVTCAWRRADCRELAPNRRPSKKEKENKIKEKEY